MRLGALLRELWHLRRGVAVATVLATLAAVMTVYRVGILPPALEPRAIDVGTAKAQALVDRPASLLADAEVPAGGLTSLVARTTLLGSLLASPALKPYVAQASGLPADAITALGPATAEAPRALTEPGAERRAADLVAVRHPLRFEVQADPAVPVLHVYAQGPSAAEAQRLADGAIAGLRRYLVEAGRRNGGEREVLLVVPLGRARGRVVNEGAGLQLALLAFVLTLSVGLGVVLAVGRTRRGWRQAVAEEQPVPPAFWYDDERHDRALDPVRHAG
jgi:hypothetical protein